MLRAKSILKAVETEFGDTYEDNKDYIPLAKAIELINDIAFRIPSIKQAIAHTKGGGKNYMYYFGKASDANLWIGAAHTSELNYVFHNIDFGARLASLNFFVFFPKFFNNFD